MTARIELWHTAKLLGSGSENGQLAFKWRDDMTARIELWHTAKLLGETQIMIKAETRTGFTLATGGLTPPNGA